jgi:hypothetical protein
VDEFFADDSPEGVTFSCSRDGTMNHPTCSDEQLIGADGPNHRNGCGRDILADLGSGIPVRMDAIGENHNSSSTLRK